METHFTCSKCGSEITHNDNFTAGYGLDDQNNKICYACCGEIDKDFMREHGKITLYLVERQGKWFVTNWPSSLEFRASVKVGHHNIAGKRYDAWFVFEGYYWHGVKYGDNTEICHCKKTKDKVC